MASRSRTPHALLMALDEIVAALQSYDLDERRRYTTKMGQRLAPLVDSLRRSIVADAGREQLNDLLSEITEVVHEVSGAATKGEMPIFRELYPNPDSHPLNRYWDLYTIFRESKTC